MKSVRSHIIVLVMGVLLGAGGMYFFSPGTLLDPDTSPAGEVSVERLKDKATMYDAGAVLYRNDKYGFSLRYPRGLVLKEFDEGNDSFTAVFQKPGEYVGFQIYITPHNSDTISGEIILRDVASGVVVDLLEEDIAIKNGTEMIRAATFWSEAPLTGKNREIWFLRNGYIFEVTAYAPVEGWTREILKTLEFDK